MPKAAVLAEHQAIVAALNKLREAAARAGRYEIVAFAEARWSSMRAPRKR